VLAGRGVAWSDETFLVPSDGSVRARRVERLGTLTLSQEPLPAPTAEAARPLLLEALEERGLRRALFGGDSTGSEHHPALQLIARVHLMRTLEPEGGWPAWDESSLLACASDGWLAPALDAATSLKQLSRVDTALLLEQTLPYELQLRLRKCAPRELQVPSGRSVKLQYVRDGVDPLASTAPCEAGVEAADQQTPAVAPILAAKLQEFFGASETPTVGPEYNPVPVLLHLLSPAERPVAITSDLPSFWAGSYSQVRSDLRDKYKRHPWPDDPVNAQPTKLTNRAIAKQSASGAVRQRTGGAATEARAEHDRGTSTSGGGGGGVGRKKGKGKAKPKGSGKFPLKRSNFKRK
jgi:ATP-dependent helicase HrpB